MSYRKFFTYLGILSLLVLVAIPIFAIRERDGEGADEDAPPHITLTTYAGETINLAEYYGSMPIIINFWATWEPSSLTDVTILQAITERYGEQILIIGINHFDPDDVAMTFLREQGITYINVPDDGTIAPTFNIGAIPKTFVINPEGTIQTMIETPLNQASLIADLEAMADLEVINNGDGDNGDGDNDMPSIDAPIPPNLDARYGDLEDTITEDGYHTLGAPNAPIQILYFGSFSCPFCLNFHDDVFELLLEEIQAGDVAFTYVPVFMTGNIPNGEGANRAAICAGEQGVFWQYSDTLYDWHERFGEEAFNMPRLRQGATNLDLDMASWDSCLNSANTDAVLSNVLRDMEAYQVAGTPTVILNEVTIRSTYNAIMREIERLRGNRT